MSTLFEVEFTSSTTESLHAFAFQFEARGNNSYHSTGQIFLEGSINSQINSSIYEIGCYLLELHLELQLAN